MRDLAEYLRAYRAYVSANLGWSAVFKLAFIWLVGMLVPIALKSVAGLPTWIASVWMISWSFLGYILGPYGMWKHQRAQSLNAGLNKRH